MILLEFKTAALPDLLRCPEQLLWTAARQANVISLRNAAFTIKSARKREPYPVKRTVKKYKVFPASSHSLLAAFYAARPSSCYSIGVNTPSLRCTRLVL